MCAENPAIEGDERYVDGYSEGDTESYYEAAEAAGSVVQRYLSDHGWRTVPDRQDLAASTPWDEDEPMEFSKSD